MIKLIPEILQYIVPGYLGIRTTLLFNGAKKISLELPIWVGSCVVSYVTLSFVNLFVTVNIWVINIICILLDVTVGVIVGITVRKYKVKSWLLKFCNITPVNETISNAINWDAGAVLLVTLKSENASFKGFVHTVGDGDGDGWICISEPVKYDKYGNEVYSHIGEERTFLTIPLNDIRYVKIFNGK